MRRQAARSVSRLLSGVSTVMDAVCYYSIVSAILGKEWLNKDLFRFGVSRLANSLISAIEQKTVTFF